VSTSIGGTGPGSLTISYHKPLPDFAQLGATDKLRLMLIRRAIRQCVLTMDIAHAELVRGQEESAKGRFQLALRFMDLLRDHFPDTLYSRGLIALWKWTYHIRVLCERRSWEYFGDGLDPKLLLPRWDVEERVARLVKLEDAVIFDMKSTYVDYVVRAAYERQEGRWLKTAFREYMDGPTLFTPQARELKQLLGLLLCSTDEGFRSKLVTSLGDCFTGHVARLLGSLQRITTALELHACLRRISEALTRTHLLAPDSMSAGVFSAVVESGCRAAWRGLSRKQAADIAELFCLALNRVSAIPMPWTPHSPKHSPVIIWTDWPCCSDVPRCWTPSART
jgi:hypothetical protein